MKILMPLSNYYLNLSLNKYALKKLKETNPKYKEYDKGRVPYDLYSNNCGTFAEE